MKCPKCGGNQSVRYGKARQKQRYKCKFCGCQFTAERLRSYTLEDKLFAMTLLASGLSMHAVAGIFGVSVQSVMRWKKSGLIDSEKIDKALRVRKLSRSGKIKLIKDNAPFLEGKDDFETGELYLFETRLPSGVRVDFAVKKRKTLHSDK